MEEYAALVVREGLGFGEAPRWHEGRLWYSDFYRRAIYSMATDGTDEVLEHEVATQPSGLGWLPDGDLLCVSMIDRRSCDSRTRGSDFADISAVLRILGQRHGHLVEWPQLRRQLRFRPRHSTEGTRGRGIHRNATAHDQPRRLDPAARSSKSSRTCTSPTAP